MKRRIPATSLCLWAPRSHRANTCCAQFHLWFQTASFCLKIVRVFGKHTIPSTGFIIMFPTTDLPLKVNISPKCSSIIQSNGHICIYIIYPYVIYWEYVLPHFQTNLIFKASSATATAVPKAVFFSSEDPPRFDDPWDLSGKGLTPWEGDNP